MAAKTVLKDATKAPLSLLRTSLLAAARSTTVPSNRQLVQALPINSQKPLPEPAVLRQYLYGIDSLKIQDHSGGFGFSVEARGSRGSSIVVDESDDDDDDYKDQDFGSDVDDYDYGEHRAKFDSDDEDDDDDEEKYYNRSK